MKLLNCFMLLLIFLSKTVYSHECSIAIDGSNITRISVGYVDENPQAGGDDIWVSYKDDYGAIHTAKFADDFDLYFSRGMSALAQIQIALTMGAQVMLVDNDTDDCTSIDSISLEYPLTLD